MELLKIKAMAIVEITGKLKIAMNKARDEDSSKSANPPDFNVSFFKELVFHIHLRNGISKY